MGCPVSLAPLVLHILLNAAAALAVGAFLLARTQAWCLLSELPEPKSFEQRLFLERGNKPTHGHFT